MINKFRQFNNSNVYFLNILSLGSQESRLGSQICREEVVNSSVSSSQDDLTLIRITNNKNKNKKEDPLLNLINDFKLKDETKNKLKEFYKYRKEIKKPIKTERALKNIINKIGKDIINEDHLIMCIDKAMDNEWVGIKGEYVKYEIKKEEKVVNSGGWREKYILPKED